MQVILKHTLIISLIIFMSGCSINGDGLEEINPNICADQTPIVFAHGFLASGDTYEKQIQRFIANGICKERMFTFDWNSMGIQNNTLRLDIFIQRILERTGSEKVFLVGHSAGSGLGYGLLEYNQQSIRVAKYVHLAGFAPNGPAGPTGNIPTLNIWSTGDAASAGDSIPGAININLIDQDHYQVATSLRTFLEMYNFFYDEDPSVIDLFDPSDTYEISGKTLSFGENLPAVGAHLEIYELDPATGFRISDVPQFNLITREDGFWGPINIKRETYYEFFIYTGKVGDRPVHYYREPFRFEDPIVIIRNYPPIFSLGSLILNSIPKSDEMATVAFFGASQAAVYGRDNLEINDVIVYIR